MVAAREHVGCHIIVDNQPLEQVVSFKYLGVVLKESGHMYKELCKRITAANRLFGALRNILMSKIHIYLIDHFKAYNSYKIKLHFFNVMHFFSLPDNALKHIVKQPSTTFMLSIFFK